MRADLAIARALGEDHHRVGHGLALHLQQVLDERSCLHVAAQLQVRRLRVEEVIERLVVQLEVRSTHRAAAREPPRRLLLRDQIEERAHSSRDQAQRALVRRQRRSLVNREGERVGSGHGVRLSAARLPVREYSDRIALERIVQQLGRVRRLEDLRLR